MGGNVLHRLIDVARNHQLRVNRKLSVADRIEQVGEAGDQRCLTQGYSLIAVRWRI
jgi:hypothetical protein